MQNSLLNELTQGTTAWILSKPVKRSTYLTAKLFGNLIPSILIISCLQGVIGVISIKLHFNGLDVATLPLIISISFANNLFYLTYSVMVSIISRSNLISIGLIFMLIFGQQMLIGVFPLLADFLPFSQTYLATAVLLSSQSPIATFTPLFLVIEAVIFMIFAIWRFNHYEF